MTSLRLAALLLLVSTGCAPSLEPLYRDFAYEANAETVSELNDMIEDALQRAGWDARADSALPVVRTQPRVHAHWGVYRVVVSLEVLPLGSHHVRVLIHPYREYIWGTRSKLPYLTGPVRRHFIPDLENAFAERGLIMVSERRTGGTR